MKNLSKEREGLGSESNLFKMGIGKKIAKTLIIGYFGITTLVLAGGGAYIAINSEEIKDAYKISMMHRKSNQAEGRIINSAFPTRNDISEVVGGHEGRLNRHKIKYSVNGPTGYNDLPTLIGYVLAYPEQLGKLEIIGKTGGELIERLP